MTNEDAVPGSPGRELFESLLAPSRPGRASPSWPVSVALHLGAGLYLLSLVPKPGTVAETTPVVPSALVYRIGEPRAAAPPPPPRGRPRTAASASSVAVLPEPDVATREPLAPSATPLETAAEPDPPAGSPAGTDAGRPGGVDGGTPGGKAGGTGSDPDGCVGCNGSDPPGLYDQPPRVLEQPRPVYPQDAFVKKVEGTVLVRMLIDADGRVQSARVLRSIPLLDEAALQAVRRWRFAPARHLGQPVAVFADAPVRFSIF